MKCAETARQSAPKQQPRDAHEQIHDRECRREKTSMRRQEKTYRVEVDAR